jgi:hypothetical protein
VRFSPWAYGEPSAGRAQGCGLELKAEGHSNRETADVLGVDERQIRRDLAAANAAPGDEIDNEHNTGNSGGAANAAPIDAMAALAAVPGRLPVHAGERAASAGMDLPPRVNPWAKPPPASPGPPARAFRSLPTWARLCATPLRAGLCITILAVAAPRTPRAPPASGAARPQLCMRWGFSLRAPRARTAPGSPGGRVRAGAGGRRTAGGHPDLALRRRNVIR